MIRRPPTPTLFPSTTLFRSALLPRPRRGPHPRHDRLRGAARGVRPPGRSELRWPPDAEPLGVSRAEHHHRLLADRDRKSTRLNSSHANISYAVFCLTKQYFV